MNIHELDSYDLGDAVKFNDRLNPRIWGADEKMRPEVREQLLRIADDFREFLGIDVEVKDITVSGSNAAFTYTPHSDIDLHLVVDLPQADSNEVYRELFDAKKYAYNDMHDIRIGGYDVELYVQDANKKHHSQGIYSIMNNDWVAVPKRRRPDVDDISVQSKFEDLGHRIEDAVKSKDYDKISAMAEKIKDYRQAGLDAHGEFGPENLAFKILRTQGLIKQLYDARNAAKDELLSLDERRKKKKKKSVRYGYGAYWYPGTAYAGQDHPAGTEGGGDGGGGDGGESLKEVSMTPDGVNPSTTMVVSDIDRIPSDEDILEDFVDFCAKELKIEQMPRVKLRRDPQWPAVHKTFGRYNDDARTLEVAWGQRHIMDVLRTVAHELTHKHQHEREGEKMGSNAGETGSPYENEANARAGVLMRDYGRLHPEYFAHGQTNNSQDVEEGMKGTAAAMAAAACIAGTPGCSSTGQIIKTTQDVGRTAQTVGKMTRAGVQDELNQELRNFIRAQGGDPNAQNQSTLYKLQKSKQNESASGYIPTKKQAKDPRFSMALTVDIRPGQVGKEANKLKLKTDRQGHPQIANPNGLFENLFVEYKRYKADEDYSPDEPPGPEFKPTMPKGTVRVDVSDVYDWYKLGQHISNMKGLGRHDFGAGPPSSIISFGDEDTEHKFIKDLEATGLDVTDIDPVDPRQPPGRKIKTDPTYNVDEVIQTPVPKGKDAEQYYKFILGKARMGRPLTRAEQDYVKMYQMYRQQKLAEGAADHVRMVMSRAADIMKQRGFRAVGQLSDRDLEQIAQETDATPHDVAIILNIDHAHEQAVAEFAPGAQRDDRGPDEEEILRQYAAQWYNSDEDPRVEKLLATMGWEIGQNEDEAGGAFVIRSGDINGDSFISWTDAELSALNEISDELRRSYLGRAGQQVDRRQTRMAQVRDRLNKGYEIYHAEDPTFTVHRFEANTPAEARRYYETFIDRYESDRDFDLQLRRATGLMESEEELDEVKMSPGALEKFATSDAAKGIRAGFEAELIFRDTQGSSDDLDPEPDYDADERAYSISQVIEFFTMDEYGYGLSDRERNRLEENLDETYMQWRDEQMISDFRNDAEDLIREKLLDETPLSERIHMYLTDSEQMSDKEADRIIAAGVDAPKFDTSKEQQAYAAENPYYQAYLDALDAAELELDESVEYSVSQQDGYWDEALDDYRDDYSGDDDSFFSDVGLRWMSDIANEFGLDWPVWNMDSGRNNGSRSWEDIGSELQAVVDMPVVVSDNYHSTSRRPGQWIIEPDGSLHADDQSEEAGLEIVSPPMPLLTAIEKLRQVTDWANDPRGGNAYTNGTTGLHMGVSLPTMKSEDATDDTGIDYVKLILFMGDKYVQQQFGREANNFCASALDKFRQNIKGKKSDPAGVVELLRHGLTELAYRELQKGVGTSKYTSAHIQNGYIEFRSPGGDWLAKSDEEIGILENTMLRFARAMAIAGDPSAERQEYAKKLYKLVTQDNPEYADQLRLFSEFSAGTINKEQLKKQWADSVLQKEIPTTGQEEYEVYDMNKSRSPEGVIDTFYARNYDDANDQYTKKYVNDPRWTQTDIRLKQPWFDVFDDTGKIVATMRASDGDTATDRAQYEFGQRWTDAWRVYRRPDESPEPEKKLSPRAQVAKRITTKKIDYNYDIVSRNSNKVLDRFYAQTPQEAEQTYSAWLRQNSLPDDSEDYGYRKTEQAADNQRDSVDIQRRLGVQDVDTDVAQNFSPDYSAYERNSDRIDAIRAQQRQAPDATQRSGSWSIYDVTLGRENSRMDNVPWQQANDRANELEQSTGHNMSVRGLSENVANESIGQHDDEQTQTALDMAAMDYNYRNWADVELRGTEQAKTAIRRHAVTKLDLAQHKDFNMLGKSRSAIGKGMQKADQDHLIRQIQTARKLGDDVNENFADGKVKGKSRPGRVKRAGASCDGSVTDLRARAKNSSGEKAKMYHWCANMKSGRKK